MAEDDLRGLVVGGIVVGGIGLMLATVAQSDSGSLPEEDWGARRATMIRTPRKNPARRNPTSDYPAWVQEVAARAPHRVYIERDYDKDGVDQVEYLIVTSQWGGEDPHVFWRAAGTRAWSEHASRSIQAARAAATRARSMGMASAPLEVGGVLWVQSYAALNAMPYEEQRRLRSEWPFPDKGKHLITSIAGHLVHLEKLGGVDAGRTSKTDTGIVDTLARVGYLTILPPSAAPRTKPKKAKSVKGLKRKAMQESLAEGRKASRSGHDPYLRPRGK